MSLTAAVLKDILELHVKQILMNVTAVTPVKMVEDALMISINSIVVAFLVSLELIVKQK